MAGRHKVIAKIVWREQIDTKKLIRALVTIAERHQAREAAKAAARTQADIEASDA